MPMQSKQSRIRVILFLFPALIGVLGFLMEKKLSFGDGLFQCVTMYFLNYTDTPPNVLVNIARWTAPIATTSGILLAITSVKGRIQAWLTARRDDSVAVYGPEEERQLLLAQLKSRGLNGTSRLLPARRYILAGEETENFAFYEQNQAYLRDKEVFLKCRSIPAQMDLGANVKLYSTEELAARLFWKEAFLYPLSETAANSCIFIPDCRKSATRCLRTRSLGTARWMF